MTISLETRQQVRQRANFACEFCGIAEIDSGDQLTVDHFRPLTKGGDDELENLIYCCPRCNQYKLAYWVEPPHQSLLWNPRIEPNSKHFLPLENGTLHPLTSVGLFTLNRLRLNRPALIANRLRRQQTEDEIRLLARYRDLTRMIEQVVEQQSALIEEQHVLLKEQQELLRLLIDSRRRE